MHSVIKQLWTIDVSAFTKHSPSSTFNRLSIFGIGIKVHGKPTANRDFPSLFNDNRFNSRQRSPSESIAEYVAALRKLTEFCNYGTSLDEMLRDRFVCGFAHPTVQKRLLTEPDLTFTKAVTVAQAVKLAEKRAQQIQSSVDEEPKEVHKFSTTNAKPPGAAKNKDSDKSTKAHCYRCGGKHNQQTCRFKLETCHFCHKHGHIAKVCKSKKHQSPPSKPTHQVRQDPPDSVPSEYALFTVPDQQSKPLQVVINIEGNPLTMEVDTGAAVSSNYQQQNSEQYT